MARISSPSSLFGFFVVLVVLSASQMSLADYMYCAKESPAYCPGKDCQAIVYSPTVSGSNCASCSERCRGDYNDAYRGSFCYFNRNCFCCFHSMADEVAYIPPTMAPAPGEVAPPSPPYVEPVAPPQAPPVFTINQDPAVSCDNGYTVSTPVDDCSECNKRCNLGSFKDDELEGVFCYDTSAGKPFCNCCIRYGAVTHVPTAPPVPAPPMMAPVVTLTPPREAPETPPCGEHVTAQAPPVMSPHDEPSAAPETRDPHAKKQKEKKHRMISPISHDVKRHVAPPAGK